jgi:hypothetical protein
VLKEDLTTPHAYLDFPPFFDLVKRALVEVPSLRMITLNQHAS